MEVPPDGAATVTRTRTRGPARITVGCTALSLVVHAQHGADVHAQLHWRNFPFMEEDSNG